MGAQASCSKEAATLSAAVGGVTQSSVDSEGGPGEPSLLWGGGLSGAASPMPDPPLTGWPSKDLACGAHVHLGLCDWGVFLNLKRSLGVLISISSREKVDSELLNFQNPRVHCL